MKDNVRDSENYILEIVKKHDPEFVEDWKAQKATANTETEAPS